MANLWRKAGFVFRLAGRFSGAVARSSKKTAQFLTGRMSTRGRLFKKIGRAVEEGTKASSGGLLVKLGAEADVRVEARRPPPPLAAQEAVPSRAKAGEAPAPAMEKTTEESEGPVEPEPCDEERAFVPSAEEGSRPSREEPAMHSRAVADVGVEVWGPLPHIDDGDIPPPPDVTAGEVRTAAFAGAVEAVILTNALSGLASKEDVTTRARAAKAMGGIRHELAVKALIAQLARERSAEVRQQCVDALAALGMKQALPAVEAALKDQAVSVRLAGVRAIYRLAGLEGATALIRMLRDENEDVRRRAATCLSWLGHEPLAVELLPLLADRSAFVRCAALEALGNLKSLQTAAGIIELLDDPQESVRKKAFHVLRTITGRQMASTFPEDDNARQTLVARWRAWREEELMHREG